MTNLTKRFAWVALVALVLALGVVPTLAQDVETGSGGPIIWPNFGGDPVNFNPIIYGDGPSGEVVSRLFLSFITVNPETSVLEPNQPGAVAESFEVSEDGTVYTFTLREGLTWSDGTPITAGDVQYSYDALASGDVQSPRVSNLDGIESIVAEDDRTVVVTFSGAECDAINKLTVFWPLPAHRLNELTGGDFSQLNELPWNLAPDVTSGAFEFAQFLPSEQIVTTASETYPDSSVGVVVPRGWIQRQGLSQVTAADEFLAGNITVWPSVASARTPEFQELAAQGALQLREAPASSWQFLAFNLADPTNPVDALDEDGNFNDQGNHPIFGDVRVRQAVAHAVNYEAMNAGAFGGLGLPVVSPILRQSQWFNESLSPYPFDQARAAELLDEAGFELGSDGVRVATADALYADEGTRLAFVMTAFSGNAEVENFVQLLQDQLSEVGFAVEIEIIEFQQMIEKLDGQTFDAITLFFGGLDPNDPDGLVRDLFTAVGDVVGSGFNFVSYINPELDALLDEARYLDGCDYEGRKAIYDEVQQILYDDLPFYFVNTRIVASAAQNNVQGTNFLPGTGGFAYNLPAWTIALD